MNQNGKTSARLLKAGMITDEKFYEKASGSNLFKSQMESIIPSIYRNKIQDQPDQQNRGHLLVYPGSAQYHTISAALGSWLYDIGDGSNPLTTTSYSTWRARQKDHLQGWFETLDKPYRKKENRACFIKDELEIVKRLFEPFVQGTMNKAEVQSSPLTSPVHIIKPEFIRRMKRNTDDARYGFRCSRTHTGHSQWNHPIIADKFIKSRCREARANSPPSLSIGIA